MSKRFGRLAWLISLSLASAGLAIAQGVPILTLRVKSTISMAKGSSAPILNPVKCDSAGNIYVRWYSPKQTTALPIVKYSPEGRELAVFDIRLVPQFEAATSYDFAVAPNGRLYLWAIKGTALELVAFKENGEYDSVEDLEPRFVPTQLALFPSGAFLASGRKVDKQLRPTGEPFTAVYDASGKTSTEVKISGDMASDRPVSGIAQGGGATPEIGDPTAALSLGQATSGDNENVYLLRALTKTLIYVISQTGVVKHRISVSPPSDNFRVGGFAVADGRIAVVFGGRGTSGWEQVIRVINAETGQNLLDYVSPPTVGGMLACYSPDGLTFVGAGADGRPAIVSAFAK